MNVASLDEVIVNVDIGVTSNLPEWINVIGRSSFTKSGKRLLAVKCDKCSSDRELFGDGLFFMINGSVSSGLMPCGCARNPSWNKDQLKTILSRHLEKNGASFVDFYGEYTGTKGRALCVCDKHGEYVSGPINNVLRKLSGCKKCRNEETGKRSRMDDKKFESEILDM